MRPWITILLGLLILGLVAAVMVYHFVINKPHPDYEKMDAAYTITAADLYKAYTSNKKAAGNKYNGKVIAFTGKLSKVETGDSLFVCVFVFNKGMFGDEGLRCTMLIKFAEQVKNIPPGTEVKLKGFCSGFNDTDVVLDKGSIVKQ